MQQFLNFIKRNKAAILRHYGEPLKFCLALIEQRDLVASGEKAALLLGETTGDARDYAISSAYALLIHRLAPVSVGIRRRHRFRGLRRNHLCA
jgi:hypothetical protein